MNTQNTTLHIKLWHREFWLMAFANLLLTMAVYMLVPTLPLWMLYEEGMSAEETGVAMGIFALGIVLPGPFCSYLVQRYRRNMVCVWAIAALAAGIFFMGHDNGRLPTSFVYGLRLLMGTAFGLAQMVLASTLIIDTCESNRRTEANHSATWFGRFALALGPLTGLLVYHAAGFQTVQWAAMGCCALSAVLILLVGFPFRVPEDHVPLFSLDRFFLTGAWPLFLNLLLVSVGLGIVFALSLSEDFYGLMMLGFVLALLAQQYVFRDAELKSEAVSGLLLAGAALLVLLFHAESPLSAPLLGLGVGIVASRFLLFFIKLSHHCQRGTSQSSFMLGWEGGIALGLGIGWSCFDGDCQVMLYTAMGCIVAALLLYNGFTHSWFVRNKNR